MHDRYLAIFQRIFSTPAGAEMRADLGVGRVEPAEVQRWLDSEANCSELAGLASGTLNAEWGTNLRPGESPFLMVRVADYPIFVSLGWTGEITPAVLLKGTSRDSHEIFPVPN